MLCKFCIILNIFLFYKITHCNLSPPIVTVSLVLSGKKKPFPAITSYVMFLSDFYFFAAYFSTSEEMVNNEPVVSLRMLLMAFGTLPNLSQPMFSLFQSSTWLYLLCNLWSSPLVTPLHLPSSMHHPWRFSKCFFCFAPSSSSVGQNKAKTTGRYHTGAFDSLFSLLLTWVLPS